MHRMIIKMIFYCDSVSDRAKNIPPLNIEIKSIVGLARINCSKEFDPDENPSALVRRGFDNSFATRIFGKF